jgi:hypothetical protein
MKEEKKALHKWTIEVYRTTVSVATIEVEATDEQDAVYVAQDVIPAIESCDYEVIEESDEINDVSRTEEVSA